MLYQKVYNDWKYEPDIFTYPTSPFQQNTYLPSTNKVCCCILAGSENCAHCYNAKAGAKNKIYYNTNTYDIEDEDIKAIIKNYIKRVLEEDD